MRMLAPAEHAGEQHHHQSRDEQRHRPALRIVPGAIKIAPEQRQRRHGKRQFEHRLQAHSVLVMNTLFGSSM